MIIVSNKTRTVIRSTLMLALAFLYGTFFSPAPVSRFQPTAEPSWHDQYFRMKKNEAGEVPSSILHSIYEQQKLSRKGNSGQLLNATCMGPYNKGGRTRALLVDRANTNRILAGGVSGGLWVSEDKGQNWSPLNDQSPTLSVTCIVQDAFNNSVFYYGTGEANTTTSVTQTKGGLPGDGIYKSTDGGKTFSSLPSTASQAFDYTRCVKTSLKTPDVVFVGTGDSGLYRSANAGNSFAKVFAAGTNDVEDIEVFKDGSIIIAVKSNGLYRSPDGSSGSFIKLAGGLPATGFRDLETAVCDSFPNVIYTQFSNTSSNGLLGAWKTTDGGSNWSQITSPETVSSYSFPWYALMIGVKPDDPNFVISGCVYMQHSKDGGATWQSSKFSRADDHVIFFDPIDPNSFYVGNDGGVYNYNTSTIATVVNDLNKGYTVTQFYAGSFFPTGVNFSGGTQDNSTLQCNNSDSLFQRIDPASGDGSYTQVNQQNPSVAYLSWQYGRIRKSTNAQSASPTYSNVMYQLDADNSGGVDDGVWFNNPFEINSVDGDQLYFTTYKRVWRTTNGAASWVSLTNVLNGDGNSPYAIGISRNVNPTVYIGGEQLKFYRVDNANTAAAGSEVNLRSSAPSAILGSFIANITVHPANESTVFVSLGNFSSAPRAYKVTNAKTNSPSWMNISGDLPAGLPVNWIEADPLNPDSFLIAATDLGVYTSSNAGKNWTLESSIPNVQVQQIRLRHSDRKLFIFTHGRGVWTVDLPSVTTHAGPIHKKVKGVIIYSNPVSDLLAIRLPDFFEAKEIRILDIRGRELMNFPLASRSLKELNVSSLNPGVYLLYIKSENKFILEKFIK